MMSSEAELVPLKLLPWPRSVRQHGGMLPFQPRDVRWTGVRTPRIEAAAQRTWQPLAALTGADDGGLALTVDCAAAAPPHPALGDDERYRLDVNDDGVVLRAPTEWGVLRALATLAQLPLRHGRQWVLPRVSIEDAPRFQWRGVMLDPARRFLSTAALERTLDAMAFFKLNVLHLHLSDDQGFRFPSALFPRLTDIGGAGRHYRRGELEALIAFAAARGIRVVPEIDMPGHCSSWLAAYPEWGARAEDVGVSRRFGVHDAVLDPTKAEVLAAIETLLDEISAVFPDAFVHIGGDEVMSRWWDTSSEIRQYMDANGIADVRALQARFNAQVGEWLAARGRRLVGWEEICHPSLPDGAVVQSWRSSAARAEAQARGFDCIVSAGYYLDLFYPADIHYRIDPEAADDRADLALRDDPRLRHVRDGLAWMARFAAESMVPAADWPAAAPAPGRVLGGEACLWGELVDERVLDVRLWSRLPAIAERLWSDAGVVDVDAMYLRMHAAQRRLAEIGGIDTDAAQRALFQSLGLSDDEYRALEPLFAALEPVKWYARLLGHEALMARTTGMEVSVERPYGTDTQLNRVVDFLPPESRGVRHLVQLVDTLIADASRPERGSALGRIVMRWREQRALLYELQERAPALADVEWHAEALGELADVVQHCLDRWPGKLTEGEHHELAAELERLAAPHGELLLAAAPAVARLLAACAPR
jgi:hexosaminidase